MTGIVAAGRGIVTPQGVVLDLPVAGVGTRTAARIIDGLIQAVLLVAVGTTSSLLGETAAIVITLIAVMFVLFAYPVVAETWFRGRTVGKAALRIRIVTLEGAPIGFREAMIRSLFQLVDLLASFGAIGVLTAMTTDKSQRLGDLAAGTFAISDSFAEVHLPAVPFTPPMGTEEIVATLDVSRLTPHQERLIRSFLLRVGDFSHEARYSIGLQLAEATAYTLGHDHRRFAHVEVYLAAVMAAHQMRSGSLAHLAITD